MVSVGDPKTNIETPALCLDLSRFEINLDRVARVIRDAGKNWRPHAKCHRSPEIARHQLRSGAIGLTCTKVSEAEVFAAAGIQDLLIAHMPVGSERVRRLAMLCRTTNLVVTCDHYVQAQSLSAECVRQGVTCRVLIEINIGMDRTGVRPGHDAFALAKGIETLPGLKLTGIMGYEGHAIKIQDIQERRRFIDSALGILSNTRDLFQKNGHCCEIVSAGGSGTLKGAIHCAALTEIQAGGAIFGAPFDTELSDQDGLLPALTVASTVVSRPAFDRAVLDAGRTAIAAKSHPPLVKDWPDAKVTMHCAEHIVLDLGPLSRELRIGDQVELIVGHPDLTTILHEEFLCFRDDRLVEIWPLEARGKLI